MNSWITDTTQTYWGGKFSGSKEQKAFEEFIDAKKKAFKDNPEWGEVNIQEAFLAGVNWARGEKT